MITLDPAFTWAALIGCINFAMLSTSFWVMTVQHRNMRRIQKEMLDMLLLAKTHASTAATVSVRTDDRLAEAVTELKTSTKDAVIEIVDAAAEAAAVLALGTPSHPVLPSDLQKVTVIGKKAPDAKSPPTPEKP